MIAILLRMGMGMGRSVAGRRAGAPRRVVPCRALIALALGTWLVACSVEQGGAGGDCVRSTECEMGLVCIEGACSDDLSSIGDPGEVPMLVPDGGMEMAMPDAGETMMMAPDAAMTPADGG